MNGLHLIGDLTGCRCDPQLLLDGERFRAKCVEMVEAAGLTTVGVSFHQFDGCGFTGCVVLAELFFHFTVVPRAILAVRGMNAKFTTETFLMTEGA